jgi:hypothetical protein
LSLPRQITRREREEAQGQPVPLRLEPFGEHERLSAYFERLLARPSYARALAEAQPHFLNFPYYEDMPERFRHWSGPEEEAAS